MFNIRHESIFNNGSEKGEQIETIGYAEASDRKKLLSAFSMHSKKDLKKANSWSIKNTPLSMPLSVKLLNSCEGEVKDCFTMHLPYYIPIAPSYLTG